ncbi:Phosphoribosyl-AMP cyclohydrolase [hydrothermal vent metagenome]|uniref:Histidine biosynthesis bifunctional protein HisIE n=1 Tax=hydrothermal vent metagenome TaxID=652676 RepID=A0A3B0SGV2_9ZZZZ
MLAIMPDKQKFADREALTGPIEETQSFAPKFGADGLLPAAVTDVQNGQLLMLAYMNADALAKTIATGEAWYWSRSRGALWRKGATSGNTQRVVEIRTDCDQDTIELAVEQTGPACHTERRSCFYRVVEPDGDAVKLVIKE